ncbi:uncharacterized protein LOC110702507 [Chenopodium quinoa]|uniref:uncharacterized protein LOC110702507 n=1 Tax=Chenopodium quinoa TaxID=63459 RepID=UPI000B770F30|nr:uncharacterized protein LOC110702507 [Chenopodium quinoa]
MALVVSFCGESQARKSSSFRKPWMLKDYLGDDLSSCSSNGFRSFPRRQCCVAVRSIIENEITRNHRISNSSSNSNNMKPPKRILVRNRSVSGTLHKASMALINAVKMLPFNSQAKSGDGKRFLPRSFSKKLFRRSFWKREKSNNVVVVLKKEGVHDDEIERWISSGVAGTEKYKPSDLSNDTTVTTTSGSNSDGKSESSWSDLTFNSDSLTCSSENDAVERSEKMEEEVVSRIVGVIAADDTVKPAVAKEKMWFNEESEKEQSSPISVLDFPYNDEGGSSPFTLRVSRLKGTQERLMQKLGRFECLAGLEPINLEGLISSSEIVDRVPKHSIIPCSTPSYILSSESEEEEDEEEEEEEQQQSHVSDVEKQAQHLLSIVNARIQSKTMHKCDLEDVLLDFFRENVPHKANDALLQAAEGWIDGHYEKLILGWEVKDKRQVYIRDMEEGGWWPRDTQLEREEVATKLGDEVMAHLMEDLMVEMCNS